MDERTKKISGLAAGVGVGAAAAGALRRRWRGKDESEETGSSDRGRRFLERLADAVRIPTVSYEDRTRIDHAAFDRLHAFLADAYPLVHERLEREVVAGHAVLYSWPGADTSAPPVLLMAHQDVVPVEQGTEDEWAQDPFGGVVDGTYLWGRGSLDDKAALIGILEAVEGLLALDFEPQVTLLLAFGDDEEVGGSGGAAAIAALLAERGVTLDFVLDEGGAVVEDLLPGAKRPLALVGIGEKGYANFEVTARGEGGHSSAPPSVTAIGKLAAAIRRLEEAPMPARLDVQHRLLEALSRVMPLPARVLLAMPGIFAGVLEKRLSAAPTSNAIIRTTVVPTRIGAGDKLNAVPQQATAVVNCRIMPGDTIESVEAHVRAAVGDDADVRLLDAGFVGDPPALSSTDGAAYQLITGTIGDVFGVESAPWILTGATDSRHFADLAGGAVYRFAPFTVSPEDMGRIHGSNERIRVDDAEGIVEFYDRLIRRACGD